MRCKSQAFLPAARPSRRLFFSTCSTTAPDRLADYQSATLSSSFQSLASARFQVIVDPFCTGECFAPADFSIDNLALSPVAAIPEPGTAALMLLPLAMLAALARRRRRQNQ